MHKPTFTLAMPNYNHAPFLDRSLEGLLEQTRPADEVLILDDASTDESVQVIEEAIADKPFARLIALDKNEGVIRGLNRLLEEATGEWIAFPAADDGLLPDFIEKMERLVEMNLNAGFVSAGVEILDAEGRGAGVRPIFYPSLSPRFFTPAETRKLLLHSDNHFWGQVTFYRREALLEFGGFDEEFGSGTDGIALREIALSHGFGFMPVRLGVWRLHGENYSLSSAFDVPEFKRMVKQHTDYIESKPPGLYPVGYGQILARRMKFGVARILTSSGGSREDMASKVAELVDAPAWERTLLSLMSRTGRLSSFSIKSWLFARLWPFSPIRFAIQPVRRAIANMSVARTKQ
ncbi:MAG: glycosyltransferase family 2 protein [Rhodobiaceae bacterium]|nr:glycosyltransferase family 2 protein [Rhodobiaceae bacterium]